MKRYFNNEVICYNATDDENAEDMTGHGTQMALLKASNSKQKKSIYGINANVQIYSIKVCNSLGLTTTQYLHDALEYCKNLNVEIINISLGGTTYNDTINDDITLLKEQGKFVICSLGDTKSNILYPANYES